ncbi:SURF1 family protein [Kribbella amoyensis]|uniref:SURF1 family cytochrome oxidase biogenesis protein n=1 Tax=Kribbella amoyensis TaxID=996641 RepID=UPI001EE24610|nr:SURF1 family protein [Kribbella amoyensis]
MRRLLNTRWIGTALVILVLSVACVQLGRWQLHRLDERTARNHVTTSNLAAAPTGLDQIVGPDRVVGQQHDWRTAVVTGRYDATKQVVVRYRNVNDKPGFEIVTPLVLADGSAILVDRGFLPREGGKLAPATVPPVPAGEVTVTGRLRRSEHGGHTSGGTPVDGTARLINGPEYAPVLGLKLYDGYLTVDHQEPAADPAFGGFPGPEIDSGPHFFYALQWFFFALLAIGGLVYFSRQDVRGDDSGDEGEEGEDDPEPVPAGPADRGLRADRGPADGGPGRD